MVMKKCVGENHVTNGRNSNGGILELPEPIIMDILSRVVPIDTIFCCRCVCKTFLYILKDPCFAKVHLAKAPNATHCLVVQPSWFGSRFYLTNVPNPDKLSVSEYNGFCPWKRLTMPDVITKSYPKKCVFGSLSGSCNGLICLYYLILPTPGYTMFCVCNPILGEFMVLPKPWPLLRFSAFGFCPKTKKYKVIRITSSLFAEIHTLGTNCWRNIGYLPEPLKRSLIDCSCLDGKYPYLTDSSEMSHLICSFNFETEQYSYIPPPPYYATHDKKSRLRLDVGILGGLFCLSYTADTLHFEVCVMNDYGVKESWTKKFTIDMTLNCMSTKVPDRLFSYMDNKELRIKNLMNNGDMLLTCSLTFPLLYYSSLKGTICDMSSFSLDEKERETIGNLDFSAIDLAPSFVSLKDMGGEVWKSSREHSCNTTSNHINDFDYHNSYRDSFLPQCSS